MIDAHVQSAGFLLELSPDWLILRASENTHAFLGEYHQRLIGEPLSRFMLAQSLHDLRNSLSRQRSSSGIARAYRVRLVDEPRFFDIAFQSLDATILLEGLPSADGGFGEGLGAVSRVIDGLGQGDRKAMLDGAARRMRALTGCDRVTLTLGDEQIENSRGQAAALTVDGELPPIVADSGADPVRLFAGIGGGVADALLRAPTPAQIDALHAAGVKSTLRVPILRDRAAIGYFQCESRMARAPSFEQHAATELFAQIFAMLLPD